jgi:hypothetical protein
MFVFDCGYTARWWKSRYYRKDDPRFESVFIIKPNAAITTIHGNIKLKFWPSVQALKPSQRLQEKGITSSHKAKRRGIKNNRPSVSAAVGIGITPGIWAYVIGAFIAVKSSGLSTAALIIKPIPA